MLDAELYDALIRSLESLDQDWYDIVIMDCEDRKKFEKTCQKSLWEYALTINSLIPNKFFCVGQVNHY